MAKNRVVIVGGGFGGLFAARRLARIGRGQVEIELINATNYFVFQPLLPEVAAGVISASDAVAPLRAMLPGVKVRQAEVIDIDFGRRRIDFVQGAGRYDNITHYDHLVLAMGQQVAVDRIPGAADHGFTLKSLKDAFRLRGHVLNRLELADVTSRPELKRRYLTFAVVGGGFSGVETIGELEELVSRSLKYYPRIQRREVRFLLIEFGPRLLAEMPADLSDYARLRLQRRGIEVRLNTALKSVTLGDIELASGELIACSTLVATVGNGPSDLLTRIAAPTEGGKILVDPFLRVRGHECVWALGDAAAIPLAGSGAALAPPTAQFAVREGRQLADNLWASLNSRPLTAFAYRSRGALASLGAQTGVAQVMGVRLSGLAAWLVWRAYYLAILPGLPPRLRVFTNWILDLTIPRNTVQIQDERPSGVRTAHFRRGEVLFANGMHYDGLYVLLEGRVSIVIDGVRREILPGQHFGERTMLAGIRARGVSTAEEDSRVLILSRRDFLALHKALPAFGREMTAEPGGG